MMDTSNRILEAREKRYLRIIDLKNRFRTIISIKGNTPGKQKKHPLACFLVKLFTTSVKQQIDVECLYEFMDEDGYYLVIGTDVNPEVVKSKMIKLEDNHQLGRLIDLDVYGKLGKISRPIPRSCLVCGEKAFDCIRNNRHNPEEVFDAFCGPIAIYMESMLKRLIRASVMDELDLEPKFGLVSKSNSGSHPDMDYALMVRAYEAIENDLYRIYLKGFNAKSIDGLLAEIRPIGIEAETKMLDATGKINAYRGLIFNLGIVLAASGWLLGGMRNEKDVFQTSAIIAKGITKELGGKSLTFGERAFASHGFRGARGEAESGYPHVKKALTKLDDFSWESKISTLIDLIVSIEDTVFLKRSGSLSAYKKHQELFKKIKRPDLKKIEAFTKYSIKHNLSFGGSADLLIVACFIKRLKGEIMI